MKKSAIFILLCSALISCGGEGDTKIEGGSAPVRFPYPEIPPMFQNTPQVSEYSATHFWNRYFADETRCTDSVFLRQAFAEYASLVCQLSPSVMIQAQDSLLQKAERSGLLSVMTSLSEYFFFNADSPFRNEECYIPVLQKQCVSPETDSLSRVRAERLLPLVSLNRTGEVAADFTYTLRNGRSGRMHDIKADKLIMFFSNPGCTSCKEIIDRLNGDPKVRELLEAGSLKVLNLYPDEDLGEWYKYMSRYPEEWINAFDAEGAVNSNEIYYLRAIPSLYLLDAEKRVICKDAPVEIVLSRL